MSDKTTVLRAYNNMLFEFMGEIQTLFPDNNDIKDAILGLEFFKKLNPTSIIKAWQYFVCDRYRAEIEKGDISFFCEKDYKSDLTYMPNSEKIMNAIQKIRDPINDLNQENKTTAFTYIKSLCKLSEIYSKL